MVAPAERITCSSGMATVWSTAKIDAVLSSSRLRLPVLR
jgi:hypothetical protein